MAFDLDYVCNHIKALRLAQTRMQDLMREIDWHQRAIADNADMPLGTIEKKGLSPAQAVVVEGFVRQLEKNFSNWFCSNGDRVKIEPDIEADMPETASWRIEPDIIKETIYKEMTIDMLEIASSPEGARDWLFQSKPMQETFKRMQRTPSGLQWLVEATANWRSHAFDASKPLGRKISAMSNQVDALAIAYQNLKTDFNQLKETIGIADGSTIVQIVTESNGIIKQTFPLTQSLVQTVAAIDSVAKENNDIAKQIYPLTAANGTALNLIYNTATAIKATTDETKINVVIFGEAAIDTNDKMQLAAPTIESMSRRIGPLITTLGEGESLNSLALPPGMAGALQGIHLKLGTIPTQTNAEGEANPTTISNIVSNTNEIVSGYNLDELNEKLGLTITTETDLGDGEFLANPGIAGALIGLHDKLGPGITSIKGFSALGQTAGAAQNVKGLSGAISAVNAKMNSWREKFDKIQNWQMLGRLLDVFTFLTALHNAWQLSSALKDTLLSVIDQGVQLIGIKDEEGNAVNTQELIGDAVESWLAKLMGEDNLNAVKKEWARYNRIINTGANVLANIQGITDGIGNVVELSASYTGKIGNALLKSKVVLDDSYNWMVEKVSAATGRRKKLERVLEGLELAQNVADSAESVLGSANSIVQEVNDLNQNISGFQQAVRNTPAEEAIENQPTKTQQDTEETASTTPEIVASDKEKAQ